MTILTCRLICSRRLLRLLDASSNISAYRVRAFFGWAFYFHDHKCQEATFCDEIKSLNDGRDSERKLLKAYPSFKWGTAVQSVKTPARFRCHTISG